MKFGRRLVQVGFMRRYDPAYRAMKEVVAGDAIGAPLMMHARTATRRCRGTTPATWRSTTPPSTTSTSPAGCSTRDRRDPGPGPAPQPPRRAICAIRCRPARDVERCDRRRRGPVNIGYGYDIRGEIVGEAGIAELAESNPVVVKTKGGVRRPGAGRLARAFPPRLRHRIPGMARRRRQGTATGPSAWDGYAATAAATRRWRRCAPAPGRRWRSRAAGLYA